MVRFGSGSVTLRVRFGFGNVLSSVPVQVSSMQFGSVLTES
jgi:hypothetical protein